MRTRRMMFIFAIAAALFALVGWPFAMALKQLHQVYSGKERRNRLVLVRILLQEYRQQFGHYPECYGFAEGHSVSWRVELLNGLHSKSPGTLTRYPGFDNYNFPLSRRSARPACFGKDNLTIFCVISSESPNWDQATKRKDDSRNVNPIIVVEAKLTDGGQIGWTEPVDIAYGSSGVVVVEDGRTIRNVNMIRDLFVLHEKGNIEWIEGPLDGREFASLLSKINWRDDL